LPNNCYGEGSKFYLLELYKKAKNGYRHPSGKTIYKNEIIAMYCNVYDFGNNSVGVSSAAKTYFLKNLRI
jgi:penicillin-binding protein 1A